MTIRMTIAMALAIVAAVVGTAAGVGAYVLTSRELARSIDESLTVVASQATGHRGGPDGGRGGPGDRSSCPVGTELAPAIDVQVIDPNGTITTCLTGPDGALPVPDDPSNGFRTFDRAGHRYRVLITSDDDGFVQAARTLDEMDGVLSQLRLRLLALVLFGVSVAVAVGWWIARGISQPIVRLRDTAEGIARTGDLDAEVPVAGPAEVASLGRSFTAMVGALSTSRSQQRRLVDDASHEMRTPLTSLTSNLEHLEHFEQLPAPERAEVLDAVQTDVHELTHLLTELVELATDRADEEAPEDLSLVSLAREVSERTARRSGRTITVLPVSDADTDTLVTARPHHIERAITNLLDNAIKYAPGDDPIEVEVSDRRVEVRDRGPGIAPDDLPHVFDRFYRATSARTEPGSGLGLAIVRQVIERHDGRVWADNRTDGPGAIVGFELPV